MGQFTTIHQNDQQSQEAWRECSNHGLRTIGSRATRRVSAGLCDWISAPHSKSAVGRGCPWSAKEVPPRFFSSKKKGRFPILVDFPSETSTKSAFLSNLQVSGRKEAPKSSTKLCGAAVSTAAAGGNRQGTRKVPGSTSHTKATSSINLLVI